MGAIRQSTPTLCMGERSSSIPDLIDLCPISPLHSVAGSLEDVEVLALCQSPILLR